MIAGEVVAALEGDTPAEDESGAACGIIVAEFHQHGFHALAQRGGDVRDLGVNEDVKDRAGGSVGEGDKLLAAGEGEHTG